jgi:hypothetical protein
MEAKFPQHWTRRFRFIQFRVWAISSTVCLAFEIHRWLERRASSPAGLATQAGFTEDETRLVLEKISCKQIPTDFHEFRSDTGNRAHQTLDYGTTP